ncbi:Peroxidase [Bertholletia excelsa]
MAALAFFLPLSLLCLFLIPRSLSSTPYLTLNHYHKSCPRFEQIMQDTVINKQITSPTTAAAVLRLYFHDCFVQGCDASVLVSSTPFNKAERDADVNLSLPADGFDLVVRAKTALELACPGVVSCADILAVAARNLVVMVGGPYYNVRLGRRDGLVSKASIVEGKLPKAAMSVDQIIKLFASNGFTVQETVALCGAHTIGFSHCKEFASNIYNFSKTLPFDPSYNPRYAEGLQRACQNYKANPTLSVFNDLMTPNKFDNVYFQNLPRGLGLLSSDRELNSDPRTRPYVETYAANQTAFFEAFGRAMEKLSVVGVKTGGRGEIRRRCDAFN